MFLSLRTIFYICVLVCAFKVCGVDTFTASLVKSLGESGGALLGGLKGIGGSAVAVATEATEEAAIGMLKKALGNPARLDVNAIYPDGRTEMHNYGKAIAAAPKAPVQASQAASKPALSAAPGQVAPGGAQSTGANPA
jgi:hypothetical protein